MHPAARSLSLLSLSVSLLLALAPGARALAQRPAPRPAPSPDAGAPTPERAPGAPPQVGAEELERALARFAHEPTVAPLVEAALEAPSLDPGRPGEAADRARWSGLLPQLRLGARRGQAWDLSALASAGTDRTQLSTDDDLTLEASARFDLGRLAFAPEEGALMRERRATEEARRERARRVIALYYERRRLQLEELLGGRSELGRALRIEELSALLDQLTGGAFERMMREGLRGERGRPHIR